MLVLALATIMITNLPFFFPYSNYNQIYIYMHCVLCIQLLSRYAANWLAHCTKLKINKAESETDTAEWQDNYKKNVLEKKKLANVILQL